MYAPPGTSAGMRVGTGLRRAPTSYRDNPGVVAAADLGVVDRPMSTHGLNKGNVNAVGGGRQTRDRNYWMLCLRNKLGEVSNEMDSFQAEMDRIESESNMFNTVEKRLEQAIKEVRELEGTLADFNLALDKHRGKTTAEDILQQHKALVKDNSQIRDILDQIFLDKKQNEESLSLVDRQIQQYRLDAEDAVMAMGDATPEANHCMQLLHELHAVERRTNETEGNLREVTMNLEQLERRARDPVNQHRLRAHVARAQLEELNERKLELEKRLTTNMIADEKNECSARMVALEKKLSDAAKERDANEATARVCMTRVDAIRKELDKGVEDENQEKKLLLLHGKTEEMANFLKTAPEEEQEALKTIAECETAIQEHLKALAVIAKKESSLPSTKSVTENHQDLQFKTQQLQNSQQTDVKIQHEIEQRKAELEKVQQIDRELPENIQKLKEKVAHVTALIEAVPAPVDVFEVVGVEKANLIKRKEDFNDQLVYLRVMHKAAKIDVDALEEEVKSDPLHIAIEEKIAQLQAVEKVRVELRQQNSGLVDMSSAQKTAAEIKQLTSTINSELVKQLHEV